MTFGEFYALQEELIASIQKIRDHERVIARLKARNEEIKTIIYPNQTK